MPAPECKARSGLPKPAREFRKLEMVAPDHKYLLGGIAVSAMALCDWTALERIDLRLRADVMSGRAVVPPFTLWACLTTPPCIRPERCITWRISSGRFPRPPAPRRIATSGSALLMFPAISTPMPRRA